MSTWIVHEGLPSEYSIHLVTPKEFEAFPEGFEFISISGEHAVKGKDYIDDDTRGGCLAYGVKMPLSEHPEAELLTKLMLQGNL